MTRPRRAIFMLSFEIPPGATEGEMLEYIITALQSERGHRSLEDPMSSFSRNTTMLTPLTNSPSIETIRRHLTHE